MKLMCGRKPRVELNWLDDPEKIPGPVITYAKELVQEVVHGADTPDTCAPFFDMHAIVAEGTNPLQVVVSSDLAAIKQALKADPDKYDKTIYTQCAERRLVRHGSP